MVILLPGNTCFHIANDHRIGIRMHSSDMLSSGYHLFCTGQHNLVDQWFQQFHDTQMFLVRIQ